MEILIFNIIYLVIAMVINLALLLIAKFYKKKLAPETVTFGFIGAILLIALSIGSLFAGSYSDLAVFTSITIAGALSIYNSTMLYFSMKRMHK